MDWTQVEVKHSRFGNGTVLSCDNGFMKVSFPDVGEKMFVYPDSFETFLSTDNTEAQAKALNDMRDKKEAAEAIRREKEALQVVLSAVAQQNAPQKKTTQRTRTAASRAHKMR